MLGEHVFTVHPGRAERARPITLAEAGLRERSDLQEWVRENPEILGDDVRIITFEFSHWQSRRGIEADRLDLLALNSDGELIVVELKRDMAPDTVEMQAIKYDAYVSRFTPASLAESHAAYLSKVTGEPASAEQAREQLEEHVGGDLDPEVLRRPRIVLMAAGFPEQVTASAVWLSEMGLDITLVQFGAYQAEHDIILTVSQVWPLPDVEEFTVSPRRAEIRAAEDRTRRQRETNAVTTLVAEALLEDGSELTFNLNAVSIADRPAIEAWIADDPRRGQARWQNDARAPLTWSFDGTSGSPTGLAREIIEAATGKATSSLAGPRHWVTEQGVTLGRLAGIRGRQRDWSDLHLALQTVRPGEWTSYGDLAELIGSTSRPVGQHVTNCKYCPNAYRVLTASGEVAANFAWADGDTTRDPIRVLEDEGVRFVNGIAAAEQRVPAKELASRSGARSH